MLDDQIFVIFLSIQPLNDLIKGDHLAGKQLQILLQDVPKLDNDLCLVVMLKTIDLPKKSITLQNLRQRGLKRPLIIGKKSKKGQKWRTRSGLKMTDLEPNI